MVRRPDESRRRGMALLVLAMWCLGFAAAARAQRLDSTIAIGHGATVWSEVLREERRLFVALPASYDSTSLRYPVLYVLDGDMHFEHVAGLVQFMSRTGLIPEMIVVGIANSHRMRDFTTPVRDAAELQRRGINPDLAQTGGADAFLSFCATELLPWVESRYRAVPFRVLVGHSLGGLMSVYALTVRPDLFQAHIAISPSLWWDGGAVEKLAQRDIVTGTRWHFLRISWADQEPDIQQPAESLAAYLRQHAPASLDWQAHHYAGYRHETSPHLALYDGLMALYGDWSSLLARQPTTEAEAQADFAGLSRKYGYDVAMPEATLVELAGRLWERGDRQVAVALYSKNLQTYPRSVRTYVRLGDSLKALNRLPEALQAYEQALRLQAQNEPYPGPNGLRRSVAELRSRISSELQTEAP